MNYILEIKAFEQWLETHYLPIPPQLLWYKIMYLCNRSGWSEWVTVDNLRLMAAMQMSREATLIKARGELIKAGLIEYQKGKKGSPNRYRIISLVGKNTFRNEVQSVEKEENTFKSVVQNEVYPVGESVVQNEVYPVGESVVQNEVYPVGESVGIYKQKHEQKQNNSPPVSPVKRMEEFISAYPKNCNRYLTETAYIDLLMTGKITEDEFVQCAINYAYACKIQDTQEKYIKNAENFLKDMVFEQYLPGKYKKPESKRTKNGFHNFQQNQYDYDDLLQKVKIN